MFELQIHVFFNHVHWDMSGSLNHDLTVVLPSDLCEFTERFQLCELCLIVRIRNRARTQPITEREGDIIGTHNLANFGEMGVEETLLMMCETPFRHDTTTARDNTTGSIRCQWYVGEANTSMNGEVIDTLFGLFDECISVDFPAQFLRFTTDFLQCLIDRHCPDRDG